MRAKVWLSMPKTRNHWSYGLGRCEDGTIRVSEILFHDGFGVVGATHDGRPVRLGKGERRMIIQDLYVACCLELGKEPDVSGFQTFGATRTGLKPIDDKECKD